MVASGGALSESGDPVARDEATRARAQREFRDAFVVEAGAGTGKTSILVARVVAWSLGPGWERSAERLSEAGSPARDGAIAREVLSRTCAITFTEAAAAEMETRIAAALRDVAAGIERKGIDADALPPEEVRRERAERLGEALEHLVVRTIHAFCRRILARFPLEAGLHPGFEVDADGRAQREIVREVVERTVAEGYGEPGDASLLDLAADGVGPPELEEALAALLADGVEAGQLAADPFAPERVAVFVSALGDALDGFAEADGGRLEGSSRRSSGTHDTLAVLDAVRAALPAADADAAALQVFAEPLRDPVDAARKRIATWAKGRFNGSETDQVGDATESLVAAARALHPLLDAVRVLHPLRLEQARCTLGPMLDEATALLRARGFVTYSQLLRKAARVLGEDVGVRARVRSGIDQLLVDEFQDTDPLQCELVRWLALDGDADSRPGLFLVGDPKQSIYGWRSADLAAYDRFVAEVQPDPETRGRLSRNFRSVRGVLDEVDRVVAPVMREEPEVQPAFQPLVAAGELGDAPPPSGRAAVEHWVSWEWNDEEDAPVADANVARVSALEARTLAQDLRELHDEHEVAWKEIGILFRGTGDLDAYLSELREAGIPYDVERERTYYRRREIVEAAAWLQTVLDPLDPLSLVATLRSAAVGLPDAALVALWDAGLFRRLAELREPSDEAFAAVDALVEEARQGLPGDVPGLDRIAGWDECLRGFVRVLAALRRSHASDPLDVFVEKLRGLSLLEAGEASRFLGAYRLANLDRLFRELESELERGGDAQALLRRLRTGVAEAEEAESARPTEAAEDAVRVMTIHKAKGLDFEHTYVVQLHKNPGGSRGAPKTCAPEEVDGHGEYALLGAPTLGRHRIREREEQVEAAERVRTLYVAATRAKRRLVLLGRWPATPPDPPPEVAGARCHMDLLASRSGGAPDLGAAMSTSRAAGELHFDDADGVRWVFPGLVPAEEARPPAAAAAGQGAVTASARERARALTDLRAGAASEMARPFKSAASADGHAGEREEFAETRVRESAGSSPRFEGAGREAARVAGTVVHRILEDLDLAAEPSEELARQRERVPRLVKGLANAGARAAAAVQAEQILGGLAEAGEDGLLGRLRSLRENVVARELDVLLPPEADDVGPVGFVSGAIDLVYRDPQDGRFVVADYKTDAIASEADADERARRYQGQGRAYQRALREALDLSYTPRFELWFVSAGIVREL